MKDVKCELLNLLEHKKRRLSADPQKWMKIMNHPAVQDFQQSNPDIETGEYKQKISKLSQYIKEIDQCKACEGLESCSNLVTGYNSQLVAYDRCIDLRLKKCHRQARYEAMQKRKSLFKSHEIPIDVLQARFDNIEFDADRMEAIDQVIDYTNQYAQEIPRMGLYLYGSFGVGKSHMAAAIAHRLTSQGIDSHMVYLPDFVQGIYNSFEDNTTQVMIDELKKVTVLILDDIGAENLNPWIRDEVIGAILQHRVAEQLPVIFTSNLSLDDLEKHLSNTNKGGHEKMKGMRIMERIRHYVKPVYLRGRNRRTGAV